jgi:hypothetical protein
VRADEKVGQYAGARAALRPITLKRLACQEESRARRLRELEVDVCRNPVDLLDAGLPDREFGINHRIDQNRASDGGRV